MIIWLNGGFGSGKTHAAFELSRRLENAFVFDPEEAGFYIASNIPHSISVDDFQDYPMWRQFNFDMLFYIAKKFEGIVIVPMTVTDEVYFNEMVNKMKSKHPVHSMTLWASKTTLEKRLRKRGDKKGSWAFDQIDRCIQAFENPVFQPLINTDELSIDEVVEAIGTQANLRLLADDRSKLRKKYDRFKIWLHHIRVIKSPK